MITSTLPFCPGSSDRRPAQLSSCGASCSQLVPTGPTQSSAAGKAMVANKQAKNVTENSTVANLKKEAVGLAESYIR